MIHGADEQQNQQPEVKEPELKFSSFVIEIEIHPKVCFEQFINRILYFLAYKFLITTFL